MSIEDEIHGKIAEQTPDRTAAPRREFGCAGCADVSGDLHEGATLTFEVGAPCKVTSRILRCDPFHRLLLTWSYPGREIDEVELRLTADGDSALVELEHRSDDQREWWFEAGSGWEYALIRLSVLLRGDDPATVSAEELDRKLGPLWTAAGRACA